MNRSISYYFTNVIRISNSDSGKCYSSVFIANERKFVSIARSLGVVIACVRLRVRFVLQLMACGLRSCEERVFLTVSLCDDSYSRPEESYQCQGKVGGQHPLAGTSHQTLLTNFVNVIDFISVSSEMYFICLFGSRGVCHITKLITLVLKC